VHSYGLSASTPAGWVGLVKHCLPSVTYTIIDSFPIPLCQSIRNHRVKVLRSIADIGYNATKKQWSYGLIEAPKAHDRNFIL